MRSRWKGPGRYGRDVAALVLDVLRTALAAARGVLDDLDADQVPADLRRVARHAGALTPPLATALLRGLDRYDWLRERALEVFPADGDEVERAFLERPPGWTARLSEAAAELALRREAERAEGAEERLARLERELGEARRRRDEAERRRAAECAEAAKRLERARRTIREIRGSEAKAEAKAAAAIDEAERRVGDAERASAGMRAQMRRLMESAAEERRRRAAAEHASATAGTRTRWPAGDPVGLAAHLDDVVAMARPPAAVSEAQARSGAGALGLPGRVAPDGAEAIDWLLARRSPTRLIVDGYNAGYALVGPGDPAAARRRLELEIERLPRLAAAPLRATVVYDSVLAGDEARVEPGGPVTVRFAAAGVSADDEIAAMAEAEAGDLVVVSDDREVREAVEAAGALALWSAALVAWSRQR